MVKIKTKKEMNLHELIKWAWDNRVKSKKFVSCSSTRVWIDENGWFTSDMTMITPNETFTVEFEEEVNENTQFDELHEYVKEHGFTTWKYNNIKDVKDETSKEFWIMNGDKMTLIWRNGELV